MSITINSFKAYDIRGRIPDDLNPDIAYRIANATVEFLHANTMVVGRDVVVANGEFAYAVAAGIREAAADLLDIGIGGTEMVYFATGDLQADGGIMVTASHNPADYNGLKLVREQARPNSGDTGQVDISKIAEQDEPQTAKNTGARHEVDDRES